MARNGHSALPGRSPGSRIIAWTAPSHLLLADSGNSGRLAGHSGATAADSHRFPCMPFACRTAPDRYGFCDGQDTTPTGPHRQYRPEGVFLDRPGRSAVNSRPPSRVGVRLEMPVQPGRPLPGGKQAVRRICSELVRSICRLKLTTTQRVGAVRERP